MNNRPTRLLTIFWGMRQTILLSFVGTFLALSTAAYAAEPAPFTPEAFAQAQSANKLIILHINAFWCPTCGAQRPILADLLDEAEQDAAKRHPSIQDLAIFTVDFDSQSDVVAQFNVTTQGTLIAFRGTTEIGRLVGDADAKSIRRFLTTAQRGSRQDLHKSLIETHILSMGSYALALIAGILSMLSPCVLPLIPLVVGSAASAHRFGVLALTAGVAVSYVVTGLFIAIIGFSIGLDAAVLRTVVAAVMVLAGIVLMSEQLQERFAIVGGRFGDLANRLIARTRLSGFGGQLIIGLLLGAVWSPCVGPTLAAAATLAAQRETLGQVAGVMALFGVGAAIPMTLLGTLSRRAMIRWRGRMGSAGRGGKLAFGGLMAVIGGLILSGADRTIETYILGISPAWLTDITIRF